MSSGKDSARRVLSGKDAQVSHPIAVKEVVIKRRTNEKATDTSVNGGVVALKKKENMAHKGAESKVTNASSDASSDVTSNKRVANSKTSNSKTSNKKGSLNAASSNVASSDCYYIIVTAGISFSDAQMVAQRLREKGYDKAQAFNDDGKVRVAMMAFSSYKRACKALQEVRKEERRKSAWILYKK